MPSDAELVREFTAETGNVIPTEPQVMTKDEVYFLVKMMLDEIMELCATVADPLEAKYNMIKMICDSKDISKINGSDSLIIAEQVDSVVDCYYYTLNAMAKKGVNFSKVFNLVHDANMDKRDPITKKFIRREDGKILKRNGWIAPDVEEEIKKQIKEGSWT